MFTVMITTRMKPEMMGEIHEMMKKGMENYEYPSGLIESTVLIDSQESVITKLLFWESEEHFNSVMGSDKVREGMKLMEHLFAGPPVIETFDTVIRATRSFAGVM